MDTITLSMLPGYSHLFSEKKIASLVACQFTFCIITTILILYFILTRVYQRREKIFHEALGRMKPLKEKLGEIQAQRQILNACLDITEDRCNVQYALLQCVTRNRFQEGDMGVGEDSTVMDASKTSIQKKERQRSGLSIVTALSSIKMSSKNEADGDGSYPFE